MAVVPAAAGEAVVLSYMVLGLLAAVMFVVALGLHGGWVYTFGALFNALGGVKIPLGFGRSIHPFRFLESASNSVANTFLGMAKRSQHTMGYFFHGVAVIQGWIAREIAGLAHDTLAWAQWIQHAHLPRWTKALIYAAFPPALLARLVHSLVHGELAHLGRAVVVHTVHTVTHTVTRIMHATTGAVAIPGWVIRLPSRVGRLERERADVWRRLRKLERYGAATGAVALFVAALANLGLRWIRCRNVTRAGRAVCATDSSLLDSLLGDALVIASAISVVTFARELLAIEDEAVKILASGIREFPD